MRMLLTLCILLLAQGVRAAETTGPVTIGGVTYEKVDPGEPFREAARPEQNWQAPAPTRAEQRAGMIAYVTPDPGDYKPYRIPKAEEHAAKLSAFLARGEDEPVWVGLYGLRDLRGLRVSVDLQGAPVSVDIRHMHFWPQRRGWRSRDWYITPELLLPCANGKKMVPLSRGVLEERSFDVKAGESTALWLTLSASTAARPGTYRASVSIRAAGRPALVLPLEIEVLPFLLQRPRDRYWLLYADVARWNNMSEAQTLAELRDFARHGMTGLVEIPLGKEDLSQIKAGTVRFDASPYLRLARLSREAGLPGPHVCSMSVVGQVRDAVGATCDVQKDPWPAELSDGVRAVAEAAVAATTNAPSRWYFYGVDEPSGDNTFAIQDYQSWRRGGAATYATFYQLGFLEKAAQYLTAPCFVSGLIANEENARKARETCEKTGAEFWWYGTGCYVNPAPQERAMFPNRYGAGYLFWKSGARAEVTWTFCRPHEDVFNDFDGSAVNAAEPKEQATAYPHFLKPDDWSTYQGAIPTIAWESLREGVDDYSYLAMLTQRIAQARQGGSAAARQAADEAEKQLNAAVNALPWWNPMDWSSVDTRRMQEVRRQTASLIVRLDLALPPARP
jgi:hypothetical protein